MKGQKLYFNEDFVITTIALAFLLILYERDCIIANFKMLNIIFNSIIFTISKQ